MRKSRTHAIIGLFIGLAAVPAIAETAGPAPGASEALFLADAATASSGGKEAKDDGSRKAAEGSGKQPPRSSRLKFRSADGTCACTCASGGTSEEDIRKAQEARERAQR